MFKRISLLLIIFICGYLLIEWVPIEHPFVLSDFVITLVLNPLKFIAAALAFFFGIVCSGKFIRELRDRTGIGWVRHFRWMIQLFTEYIGLLIVFILLFQIGWEHTLVFFSLSLLYGMISVEL
ncbi:hypothetical protein M3226_01775 [Neobacillus cucumis]|uniref:hypothetical protein n=1 Tax=Neobacillus cucumis TaxID=1740721 RepID=UPI0020426286|nr:hypothetical protein [Neobacillus cucumis]MCM3724431.1 hypothetical protein [Neobacillus cucumis]